MASSVRRSFPSPAQSARALVLRAHPLTDSFNNALADAWTRGAEQTGVTVESLDVHKLRFDPLLHVSHRSDQPLEPDLLKVQKAVSEAAIIVVAFPIWWGSTPAALKGLFDRAFLPGWAYSSNPGGAPTPGLAGRTGRLLITSDAPTWYDRLVYFGSARRQVGRATLVFCGIRPVRTSAFGSIESTTAKARETMLVRAERAGTQDGQRCIRMFPKVLSSSTPPQLEQSR